MTKDIQLQFEQILGTPVGQFWSQARHFRPEDEAKYRQRGELLVLVSLKAEPTKVNLASLGTEIITRIGEEYFGNLEAKPMERLKQALSKVAQEKSIYFPGPSELTLMALVLWHQVVYLAVWGSGEIWLRRQGKTGAVIKGGRGLKIASGVAQEDDLFLLATEDFFTHLPQGMITAALSTEDLETIGEVLIPVVHAREHQGNLAAIAVKLGTKIVAKEINQQQPHFKIRVRKPKLTRLIIPMKKIGARFGRKWGPKASNLTLALGFLLLLSLSVFFGWRKQTQERRLREISQLSKSIEENLAAANSIRGLDPESSLKLIKQAEEKIDQLIQLDQIKGGHYRAQAESLMAGLGEKAVKPQLYYDLNLVAESVEVSRYFSDGQALFVLDRANRRVLKIDLENKRGEIIAGGERLAQADWLVASPKRIYLIAAQTIYWWHQGQWQSLVDLREEMKIQAAGIWLGNLYLLDANQKQIWKYPAISQGLGRERAWLKSTPEFDFDQVVDLAIDGRIWLLLANGRVYKFFSGREDRFVQQLPPDLGRAQFLTVAQEGEVIAFWDQEKNTIWTFDKEGQFLARVLVKLDDVRGLVLSPKGEAIYLLTRDKVYRLEFSGLD